MALKSMGILTRLLAPYIAVVLFWCLIPNAWLCIAVYHLQILLWSGRRFRVLCATTKRRFLVIVLPAALAGPLVYVLLPCITHMPLVSWLCAHHLSSWSFALMIPWFGLVHPVLEQIHWDTLRRRTWLAHPVFAGYHVVVLGSLLTLPWLAVCFLVLIAVSVFWGRITKLSGSLAASILSHVLADTGIILAAWFIVHAGD